MSFMTHLRAPCFALLISLIAVSSSAQEAAPQEPAPPEEPKEITGADFAVEAKAVEDRLARIRSEVTAIDVVEDVQEALAEIVEDAEEVQEQFRSLGTRRMMSSELNAMRGQLELLDARTDRQVGRLSTYGTKLEKLTSQNEDDIDVWTRALESARGARVPEEVRDRTTSILKGLRDGQKLLRRKLNEALALQTRTLEVRDAIDLADRALARAQRNKVEATFQRQDPPLWKAPPFGDADEELADREGYELEVSWPSVTRYVQEEIAAVLSQLFLVLTFGWLFVRMRASLTERREKQSEQGGTSWEDRAIQAVTHPWAAALLVSFGSMRFLYADRVVDLVVITWVVMLPLWFIVFKEMVPRAFQKSLIGLGLLGTLHILVTLVSGRAILERAFLLLELVLALAGAVWLARFFRAVEVEKRVRQGLWFTLSDSWTRVGGLIAAVGIVAAVLGYTYFAEEAALVVVLGSIGATAWMAIARIVEAVVASAIYARKLDGFRMVRANRDTTAKMLTRAVRLAAAVVFFWAIADGTTAWRPLGKTFRGVLDTDLGLGFSELGMTVGDLFAFFIILWLSWLLARFVSFVLREELFPRLHMKQGVPYALTTFTRYVIIAIGFIAAMSVLGIPLDRVTIVLGALGVGIGFGLQNLVNDVVSGFVLLTERPVRLRDKVEIEGMLGNVSSIGIRASTIRTFDGAEVIVPNGDLISQRVINWTLSARQQRVTIPVGVAYGTDPNQVLTILRRVAAEHDGVFKDPAPLALFRGFGDSSLDFELRIFMDPSDVLDVPSEVTVAIDQALKEANIKIPFPQRDVHIKEGTRSPSKTKTNSDT